MIGNRYKLVCVCVCVIVMILLDPDDLYIPTDLKSFTPVDRIKVFLQ